MARKQLAAMKTINLNKEELRNYGSGIRCIGSELGPAVGVSGYSGDIGIGTDVAYLDLTPTLWTGTRVQVQAGLWEKFKINKLKIEYVPTVSTLQNGGFVMAIDNDWEDDIPSVNIDGVRRMTSFEPSLVVPAFKGGPEEEYSLLYKDLPGRRISDSFFTGDPYAASDPRLSSAGWFGMKAIQDMSSSMSGANGQFGYIVIHYDISFYIAELSPSVGSSVPQAQQVAIVGGTNISSGSALTVRFSPPIPTFSGKVVNFTPTGGDVRDSVPGSTSLLNVNRLYSGAVDSSGENITRIWDATSSYVGNFNFGFLTAPSTSTILATINSLIFERPGQAIV